MAIAMWCQSGIAQVYSGYLQQGFEETVFPPTDWQRISVTGANQWVRNTAEHHTGVASTWMSYQATGGEDWLITPKFAVVATDKVTFWLKLDFQGYQPDQLTVRVSNTTALPAAFTNVLLTLQEGTNYPPDDDNWYPFEANLAAFAGQEVYIAFRHTNTDGDGLYLDDIAIGTLPANDVSIVSIDGGSIITAPGIAPQLTVKNNGSDTQTFNVTVSSTDGYSSTMPVTALAANATQQVTFANWLPPAMGAYTLTATADLPTDTNMANNTLTKNFTLYANFPNEGWLTKTALPTGRWAQGAVAKTNATFDAASVFAISGNDAAFNATAINEMYSEPAGNWATMAPMPAPRSQVSAAIAGDKIYVPGGYVGSFAPSNVLHIYDIPTNTWTTGAAMLTAVGDYAIAVYNDAYIYVIGGYNGSADVNTVQVYDIAAGSWSLATAKSGTAVAGLRGGIANGKIVTAGGYSQTVGASVNQAQLGVINPANPLEITWSDLPAMPFGTTSRFAGGGLFDRVYFTGGDPNGGGTSALASTFAYNVTAGQWEVGPAKPTGVSNICNFSPVLLNGRAYLVAIGGYNGSAVVGANEWLDLGEYCTLAAAPSQTNVSCNGATDGSASVAASNGFGAYSYLWDTMPAQTTPSISGLAPGTYTVTISDNLGCSITESFTITQPDALSAAAQTQTNVSCNGNADGSATVAVTGGTGTYFYSWAPLGGDAATATGLAVGTYTVTITDANSCTTTQDFTITEPPAMAINTQPQAQTTAHGGNATFSVSADNANGYQWQVSTDGGITWDDVTDGGTAPIYTGAQTSELSLTGIPAANSGQQYRVVVSQNTCTLDSAEVTLTVTNVLLATNDDFSTIEIVEGIGGIAGDLTVNDLFNGTALTDTDVVIVIANQGGLPGATVDAQGQLTIPAVTPVGTYTLTYSICEVAVPTNCSMAEATVTVTPNLATEQFTAAAVRVYPNPASSEVSVSLPNMAYDNMQMAVYDVNGRTILQKPITGETTIVDIAQLASGVYVFRISGDQGVVVKQIIKK